MTRRPRTAEATEKRKPYRSPYEAYPFLGEPAADRRCDFELLTDEMASQTGLLRSLLPADMPELRSELQWIGEMIYHLNATARSGKQMATEDISQLLHLTRLRQVQAETQGFVLPAGTAAACIAHILRVQAKKAVRLLYAQAEMGQTGLEPSIDFVSLLSAYFFALALSLNAAAGTEEIPFVSRVYRSPDSEQQPSRQAEA